MNRRILAVAGWVAAALVLLAFLVAVAAYFVALTGHGGMGL